MLCGGFFDVDKKLSLIAEEEQLTQTPDFWYNSKSAELVLKSIRDKKAWTDAFRKATDSCADLHILYEFYIQGEGSEAELDKHYAETINLIEDLEFRNMLSGEEDKFSTIIQINSGAGGTERSSGSSRMSPLPTSNVRVAGS